MPHKKHISTISILHAVVSNGKHPIQRDYLYYIEKRIKEKIISAFEKQKIIAYAGRDL